MYDSANLPITSDSARAARNYYGLTQQQAAEDSGLPAHKIKRFEAGNFIPDMKFLEDLRKFYEGKGYNFPDTPKPGTQAKATGKVFPAGVVQPEDSELPDSTAGVGKRQKSTVQHIRIDPALTDDEIGNILDHIERNEEHVSAVLNKKVEEGLFGALSGTSEAHHGKALRLLAENGTLLAKLFGRPLVQPPSPELASGKAKPKTQSELLAHTQRDMHAAIKGDVEAKAKAKAEKSPQTLTEAIFG